MGVWISRDYLHKLMVDMTNGIYRNTSKILQQKTIQMIAMKDNVKCGYGSGVRIINDEILYNTFGSEPMTYLQ
jgi:hypothetical protein